MRLATLPKVQLGALSGHRQGCMCGSAVHLCVCTWVRSKEILVVTDRDGCVEVLYTGVCVLGLGLSKSLWSQTGMDVWKCCTLVCVYLG